MVKTGDFEFTNEQYNTIMDYYKSFTDKIQNGGMRNTQDRLVGLDMLMISMVHMVG